MREFRNYYVRNYEANEEYFLKKSVESPVVLRPGWEKGAMWEALVEIEEYAVLVAAGARRELTDQFLRRCRFYIDAIEANDLCRHGDTVFVNSTVLRIKYMCARGIFGAIEKGVLDSYIYNEVAREELDLYEDLVISGQEPSIRKMSAIRHLIMGGNIAGSVREFESLKPPKFYAEEYEFLALLLMGINSQSCSVRGSQARESVLSFFDRARDPDASISKTYNKTLIDRIELAILVAMYVEPGDHKIDIDRAIYLATK